jgi:release factor glutamine methyltransferase
MPVSPSSSLLADVVATLRAAGCVFAEDEAELLFSTADTPDELAAMVRRRSDGLPLEHVLGWAEFRGLRVQVDPGVFVPRRRTEFMVEQATALAGPRPVVLDLCCGTGALGLALTAAIEAARLGPAELWAADLDPAAVGCARRNLAPVGGRVFEGDLFEPLPAELRGRVTILLANVPYVPSGEIRLLPSEARDHEARIALDGGGDGLDLVRRVASAAPEWLGPGGSLLVETSETQAGAAAAAFTDAGLAVAIAESDELGATVLIGTRPG